MEHGDLPQHQAEASALIEQTLIEQDKTQPLYHGIQCTPNVV